MGPVKGGPPPIPLAGFLVTLAIVGAITLNPTPVDAGQGATVEAILRALHALGMPTSFGYAHLEFIANIVMFTPLGFFLTLTLPRRRRWSAALALPLLSVALELTQYFALPARYATVPDVVANSLGAWFGIGLALLVLRVLTRRATRTLIEEQIRDGDGLA